MAAPLGPRIRFLYKLLFPVVVATSDEAGEKSRTKKGESGRAKSH